MILRNGVTKTLLIAVRGSMACQNWKAKEWVGSYLKILLFNNHAFLQALYNSVQKQSLVSFFTRKINTADKKKALSEFSLPVFHCEYSVDATSSIFKETYLHFRGCECTILRDTALQKL